MSLPALNCPQERIHHWGVGKLWRRRAAARVMPGWCGTLAERGTIGLGQWLARRRLKAHALVVGITAYQHITSLPTTVLKDARDIRTVLVDPADFVGLC